MNPIPWDWEKNFTYGIYSRPAERADAPASPPSPLYELGPGEAHLYEPVQQQPKETPK